MEIKKYINKSDIFKIVRYFDPYRYPEEMDDIRFITIEEYRDRIIAVIETEESIGNRHEPEYFTFNYSKSVGEGIEEIECWIKEFPNYMKPEFHIHAPFSRNNKIRFECFGVYYSEEEAIEKMKELPDLDENITNITPSEYIVEVILDISNKEDMSCYSRCEK